LFLGLGGVLLLLISRVFLSNRGLSSLTSAQFQRTMLQAFAGFSIIGAIGGFFSWKRRFQPEKHSLRTSDSVADSFACGLCGHEIPSEDAACDRCGFTLGAKSPLSKWTVLAGVFGVVGGGAAFWCGFGFVPNGPGKLTLEVMGILFLAGGVFVLGGQIWYWRRRNAFRK
jgi:hypothetical protein